MNVNQCFIAGNLVRNPETTYTQNNTAVTNITVAVNRNYKDSNGQYQEKANFFDATVFGKRAEAVENYFTKGDPIFLQGRLQQDRWTNDDGQNRSKVKVIVEDFQFVNRKSDNDQKKQNNDYQQNPQNTQREPVSFDGGGQDDDVPF